MGFGMGGFGSGRWGYRGRKPTCESFHSVDLAHFRRHGLLDPGRSSTLTWSRGGEKTGSITVIAQRGGVRLNYWIKDHDRPQFEVNELVPFLYTPTRFGGRRRLRQLRRQPLAIGPL